MSSRESKPDEPSSDQESVEESSGIDRERLLEDAKAFGKARGREKSRTKDDVEEASEESFPASDPPSFTPNTGTGPKRRKK